MENEGAGGGGRGVFVRREVGTCHFEESEGHIPKKSSRISGQCYALMLI